MNRNGRRRRSPGWCFCFTRSPQSRCTVGLVIQQRTKVYKWAQKIQELARRFGTPDPDLSLRTITRRKPNAAQQLLGLRLRLRPVSGPTLPLPIRAREDDARKLERPRTMMACRRMTREAIVASLRRGAAPACAFSSSFSSAASCSSRALSRAIQTTFSSHALPSSGPSRASQVAVGLRPQL